MTDALEKAQAKILELEEKVQFLQPDEESRKAFVLAIQGQKKHIEQLEAEARKVIQLLYDVGKTTNWKDREQTDRVFAWYEFDGLRALLDLGEPETAGDTPSPVQWTKEPPIEPGWYWWKYKLSYTSEPKRYDIVMVRAGYWWPVRMEMPK